MAITKDIYERNVPRQVLLNLNREFHVCDEKMPVSAFHMRAAVRNMNFIMANKRYVIGSGHGMFLAEDGNSSSTVGNDFYDGIAGAPWIAIRGFSLFPYPLNRVMMRFLARGGTGGGTLTLYVADKFYQGAPDSFMKYDESSTVPNSYPDPDTTDTSDYFGCTVDYPIIGRDRVIYFIVKADNITHIWNWCIYGEHIV